MISMFPRPLRGSIQGGHSVLILGVELNGTTLRYLILKSGALSIVGSVTQIDFA